jgi:hypothetical protein
VSEVEKKGQTNSRKRGRADCKSIHALPFTVLAVYVRIFSHFLPLDLSFNIIIKVINATTTLGIARKGVYEGHSSICQQWNSPSSPAPRSLVTVDAGAQCL